MTMSALSANLDGCTALIIGDAVVGCVRALGTQCPDDGASARCVSDGEVIG